MTELVIRRERKQTRYFTEKLGDTLGLDMILIPGRTFAMGSTNDEPERSDVEGPQHEVNVSTFFLGRYPITQAQWQFVAGLPQIKQELKPDPSNFKGDKRPVENVSWYEAIEFCDRLSVYTEREYRLPTEAEWEYACRASPIAQAGTLQAGEAVGSGQNLPFHFGETISSDLANYDGNDIYNNGPKGKDRGQTTPVDDFGIGNAFGLCDLHGNVWEWCLDHWHGDYEGAPTDGSAWLTENEGSSRIRRGGSWISSPRACRSASRFFIRPTSATSPSVFVSCVVSRGLCSPLPFCPFWRGAPRKIRSQESGVRSKLI